MNNNGKVATVLTKTGCTALHHVTMQCISKGQESEEYYTKLNQKGKDLKYFISSKFHIHLLL